jgi:glycosyltransferase involved in cell wall biosynthesis
MKPRILYITAFWPHGQWSGGQLRTLHIARALQQMGEVKLCILDCHKVDQKTIRMTADEFRIESFVKLQPAAAGSGRQRLKDLLDPRRMNLYGLVAEESARAELLEKVKNFDLVWLRQLHVSYLLKRWHWSRSVMDIDDVPSTYERLRWQNASGMRRWLMAGRKMLGWRGRERLLGERFSVLTVASEEDRRYLRDVAPIHVIPNGFERPVTVPRRQPSKPSRIGFIGIMEYPPNCEGVRWFVRECWSAIKREVPDARLRLVGKGSDGSLKPNGPDIDGLGWIPDAAKEIETWSMMIVPIHVGGGTRVKIAEAFSRKCPLVSTRVGAFGYDVVNGRELCIADTADEFARACLKLIHEPSEAAAMAERAWGRFLKEWTWDAIAPRIWAAAEDCLRRSASVTSK